MQATLDDGMRSTRRAPAPWSLHGEGYLFGLRTDRLRPEPQHGPAGVQRHAQRGPLSYAIFMDYAGSPVGPYRELLYIPGTFRFGTHQRASITRIYVSTQASLENGRRNWGIPKELATFTVEHRSERLDHVAMRVDGELAVELTLQHAGPTLPVATWLLPRRLRTLGQQLDGKTFEVTVSARGRAQRAKVEHAWSDETLFPAMTPASIAFALKLGKLSLAFPEPTIR